MLPMHPVEELLWEIDQVWKPSQNSGRIRLRIVGSSALFLQTDYRRGTEMHHKHGMYIEILSSAFPFLAEEPNWVSCPEIDADLKHFTVEVLEVVDVVVAKLARLHGADRGDIRFMVLSGHVNSSTLIRRFRSAVQRIWHDARAEDLPRYVQNLHWVERDLLGEEESVIELPSWIGNS